MDSSSLFKFTEGEVEAENIVFDGLPKDHFNGNSKSKGGRKGRCLGCNKFGHYEKECLNGRDTSLDDDNNYSRDIFNDQRNDR